jgi:hypothetical protein
VGWFTIRLLPGASYDLNRGELIALGITVDGIGGVSGGGDEPVDLVLE